MSQNRTQPHYVSPTPLLESDSMTTTPLRTQP